ncbi:MAG: o-succinylbenzoate synthase [Endozoicomonas sp.]|uniref:o-succinylbenzoate synthase n=1 Tax=Endozoicomonas sp. TaxID=1892382 RepID=UPI003D9BB831
MKEVLFQSCHIYRYRQPLVKPLPLKTVTLTDREGLILEVVDQEGLTHYGEASPLPDFSQESLFEALEQLKEVAELCCLQKWSDQKLLHPSVAFAIESIQFSADRQKWCQQKTAHAPLLMGADASTLKRLKGWQMGWPNEFKLKVGRNTVSQDVEAVNQLLECIPGQIKLRLDANQRWSLDEAIQFSLQITANRVSYIEEPTGDCRDFPQLFSETGIGYALDETLQFPVSDFRLSEKGALKAGEGLRAIVLKPTLVGGISRCLSLAGWARKNKVRTVFSSSFESALGVSLIEQLSLECDPFESPGLDTLCAFQNPEFCGLPDYGKPLSLDLRNAMETVWSCCSAH